MGSYAECWLGKFYLGSTVEEDIDPSLLELFRSSDKKVIHTNKNNLPNPSARWVEYIEDEDNVTVVFYSAPAKIIKDRLELVGYSLDNAKKAYLNYLKREIDRDESLFKENKDIFKPIFNIISSMDVEIWLSTLKEIYNQGLTNNRYSQENDDNSHLQYMLKHDWYGFPAVFGYGFPGVDINVPLRLMLEVTSEEEELIYDITDLVLSEYFDPEENFLEYVASYGKTIILTEGKFDTFVLSESLNLLYPHLADYFSFMDFDGSKVGGGAGNLATMVKSFSGAEIINKVVAIFDNDTAARASLKALQKVKVSRNIKIYTLPDLKLLYHYPTLGPSGMVPMNVNGLAGSIELYLGRDVLQKAKSDFYPIQWMGFDSGLKQYQGEILEKDSVQKKFKQKLKFCKDDKSLISNFDWSGIKLILEDIFKLFHEDDGHQIISHID